MDKQRVFEGETVPFNDESEIGRSRGLEMQAGDFSFRGFVTEPEIPSTLRTVLALSVPAGRRLFGLAVGASLLGDPRETLANLSKTGHLCGFSDQPVAEIVQCGEPAP